MYSRMHASTTHCNSCARMLLSPAQLLACARGRRRRSAAPALAYSSARPWRARHGCSISGQKRILHARMHAPPTQCSSCARMLLSPTQLFACLHAHACAAAALQLLRSHAPQPAHGALLDENPAYNMTLSLFKHICCISHTYCVQNKHIVFIIQLSFLHPYRVFLKPVLIICIAQN